MRHGYPQSSTSNIIKSKAYILFLSLSPGTMKNSILKIFFFILLVTLTGYSHGQVPDSLYIDLDNITTYKQIRDKAEGAYLPPHTTLERSYADFKFRRVSFLKVDVPAKFVNHKLVLRFYAVNHSEVPDSVWFFPGFFYSAIQLYRLSGNKLISLRDIKPQFQDSIGYRLLTLAPHDSSTFLAELSFVKTYTNGIRPRLIQKTHLSTFIFDFSTNHLYQNITTYIFCGLLLMMILFSIANYLLGGSSEFLYYTGYALFLGGMLFTKTYYDYRINNGVFFMEAYLDFVMQCTGIGFYMVFMQKFL